MQQWVVGVLVVLALCFASHGVAEAAWPSSSSSSSSSSTGRRMFQRQGNAQPLPRFVNPASKTALFSNGVPGVVDVLDFGGWCCSFPPKASCAMDTHTHIDTHTHLDTGQGRSQDYDGLTCLLGSTKNDSIFSFLWRWFAQPKAITRPTTLLHSRLP